MPLGAGRYLGATYLSIVPRSQSLQLKTLCHPTVHLYPHYPVSSMRGRALVDSFECTCLESKAVTVGTHLTLT